MLKKKSLGQLESEYEKAQTGVKRAEGKLSRAYLGDSRSAFSEVSEKVAGLGLNAVRNLHTVSLFELEQAEKDVKKYGSALEDYVEEIKSREKKVEEVLVVDKKTKKRSKSKFLRVNVVYDRFESAINGRLRNHMYADKLENTMNEEFRKIRRANPKHFEKVREKYLKDNVSFFYD